MVEDPPEEPLCHRVRLDDEARLCRPPTGSPPKAPPPRLGVGGVGRRSERTDAQLRANRRGDRLQPGNGVVAHQLEGQALRRQPQLRQDEALRVEVVDDLARFRELRYRDRRGRRLRKVVRRRLVGVPLDCELPRVHRDDPTEIQVLECHRRVVAPLEEGAAVCKVVLRVTEGQLA